MIRNRDLKITDIRSEMDGMSGVKKGFTLIELMIVVAVIAILVALSYPSYVSFIRKSERSDAQGELLDWANRQHIWRADHISYNAGINPANSDKYTYSIEDGDLTTISFILTATAQDGQASDTEEGTDCSILTMDETGLVHEPAVCWK
jgi:type IV pilus assembly protein PilE